jgi:hypothetical protein
MPSYLSTQINIEYDCVRVHSRPHASGFSGVRCGTDDETRLSEGLGKQAEGQPVILDDEHGLCCDFGLHASPQMREVGREVARTFKLFQSIDL